MSGNNNNKPGPEPPEYEIPVRIVEKEERNEKPSSVRIEVEDSEEGGNTGKEDESMKKIDHINRAIEERDEKIGELEEQIKRLSAEFSNFRLRQEKRIDEIRKYAAEDVIKEFFQVMDSLEKAISVARKTGDIDSLVTGMEMIHRQMCDTLQNLGLEEISALGCPFDPACHHAVHMEESGEHPEDTVTDVYQKGYRLKDRVIRPSMVKVSKKPAGQPENSNA